jgi:hypothetical protein
MADDFDFHGWDRSGELQAVFKDGVGNTKTATLEAVEADYWHHVHVEQGAAASKTREATLSLDEARVALSRLDLRYG